MGFRKRRLAWNRSPMITYAVYLPEGDYPPFLRRPRYRRPTFYRERTWYEKHATIFFMCFFLGLSHRMTCSCFSSTQNETIQNWFPLFFLPITIAHALLIPILICQCHQHHLPSSLLFLVVVIAIHYPARAFLVSLFTLCTLMYVVV